MAFSAFSSKPSDGFTLIELLVVISIIGLLSSIILASLTSARARARDSVRLSDLHQLSIALELYRTTNGSYPLSGADSSVHPFRAGVTNCSGDDLTHGYGYGATGYIQNLVPTYISKLPEDPVLLTGVLKRCYAYASNGTDYMIIATNSEVYNPPINLNRVRDLNNTTIAVFTSGAVLW
jgi:type II secretion system protein G